jgi:hypothetical protein
LDLDVDARVGPSVGWEGRRGYVDDKPQRLRALNLLRKDRLEENTE